MHRQPGVDDGVHEHHLAAVDLGVQILEEANAVVVLAVARELDEIEMVVDGNGAGEVAEKRDAGLERADEQRLAPLVRACKLGTDLANPAANLVGFEEYLADPFVELGQCAQDAFRSPYRAASRSKSRS
jgi:hypothetical protein